MGKALVMVVLAACSSGTDSNDGGSGLDAGSDAGATAVTHTGNPPLTYGVARKYVDGAPLFGSTNWTSTPPLGFVVILSSVPVTCATDFTVDHPVTDAIAYFVVPFFLDSSAGAEAQVIGIGSISVDAGPSIGSSGYKPALDAYIKSSSATSVSGTIDFNAWIGSFVVPVCP